MIRVLVVGTGSIGERHVRCLLATRRAQVGICEVNEALRRKIADQYGVAESFATLEASLQARWEAAVIATPAPLHVSMALQLARAGIHLLIEKPLSTSLEGTAELVAAVRERNLTAAVAYVYRAHPALTAMKQAIDTGRFGRPLQLTALCGQDFAFYRPAYRQIYYARRDMGGGAIQDALTHIFNAGEWLVGPIGRIAADAAHQHLDGVEVEDTVHAIVRHGTVLGNYHINQYQSPTEIVITVVCEKGTARFELKECRWKWMTQTDGPWQEESFGPLERDDWFIRQERVFLDAMEQGSRPPCTLEEGLQTLKVNLAALASADSGGGMRAVE
jgi:predicted dehydrogenase